MHSDYIKKIIYTIEQSIQSGIFKDVENATLELKDLSTGAEWKSLKESICAFLNSDGGIVICGIRERNKHYSLTGFDRNNEQKLIELQTSTFQNDDGINVDVSDFIFLNYEKVLAKEVAVIYIKPLSDDLKFVKFENVYKERKLTGDYTISLSKINSQKEYKTELEQSKELTIVQEVTIDTLSLDKLNIYINLLNKDFKNETLKPDITSALSFLERKYFITKKNKITTLGLLLFGEDPFRYMEYRSEVDCFFDSSKDISKDKGIYQSDVISLIDSTFRFIWGHINVGRTYREGGVALPEYPEELIREVINNAIAHRDYTINNFITVNVEPNEYLEIKNPGSFKEKIKIISEDGDISIRRLIPGIPESKNPKLASVLKVFDKIESKGRGMASLVNAALSNLINLPYYEISADSISLKIPTGKLVDEEIDYWLNGYSNYLVSKLKNQLELSHKQILAYFYKSELLNRRRCFTILLSENNNHTNAINALRKAGLIIEHASSKEYAPVYIVDRELIKEGYADELIELFGDSYIQWGKDTKLVLTILYRYTKYNKEALRATDITPQVYRLLHSKNMNAKTYETLGRKIRGICKKLVEENFVISTTKNRYLINLDFEKSIY